MTDSIAALERNSSAISLIKNNDPYTSKIMTTALHLAYRPQTLQDLVGQSMIQRTLSNSIAQQHIAPAYLFTGSRGTGKTSTARIFAKSLNCLNSDRPTTEPCGQCQSCRSIEISNSLDVTEIDAASHNGVDDARELTQRVNLAPVLGRYRVVIMDECLAGDSLILTDSGLVRIDNPAIVGKNVLSFNEKNENWEFKPITCQWIRGKRHTLAIKTTASEIRCTPEHLIRTSHGWKRAETIQPGDRILIAPHTFLPKSGSKFLNSYDPLVPVDVENDWTFPFSINAAQSITLLAPTGSNTQLRRTTGLNNRLPIKSLYLNLYAPSACVDVAGGLIFQSISSTAEPLPPEFSTIGQTIPTTIRMALNKPQFASAMMPSSPFHSKLWGKSTEPYWVMDQLATHMLLPFPPEFPGHMALTRRTGYDINVSSSQSLSLRSVLYPIRATGTPRFAPEPFVIPISKKSTTWCDQMSIASKSIQTGSTASVKKVWHGGT
jgi:DNA polymerase-3 subunit gamma/tau